MSATAVHPMYPPTKPMLLGGWREPLVAGLLATLWSLAERGFEGARWSDVPIIKSFVDPRLYRQDPFIWTLHEGTPAAFSYQLIALVVRALPFLSLDQALFVVYLPVTVAALALLYRLALLLTSDRLAGALFLVLYVVGFRLLSVGSAILHSAETTPQTLALPLQLGSLYALLRGRLATAGLLMGLACNLHVPSTVYLGGALTFYELVMIRRLGARAVAKSLVLLGLAAAPALVGSLLYHRDPLPRWALSLARAELATDISLAIHFSSRALATYNLLGLALLALVVLRAPRDSGRAAVLTFLASVGLMCLAALAFFDLWLNDLLSTLVARLQLPRAVWLANVLGLVYLARELIGGWRDQRLPRPLVLLVLAAMLAAPADFTPLDPLYVGGGLLLVVALLDRSGRSRRLLGPAALAVGLICLIAGLARLEVREYDFELSRHSGLLFLGLLACWQLWRLLTARGWQTRPALAGCALLAALLAAGLERGEALSYALAHRGGLRSAAEFQEWARTSTPVDSVFLILPSDPNNNSFYENADRAIFLVRERANQAVYFAAHSYEFERRVRALGIEQPLRYREELDPAYRRLTEEKVRQLAQEFGVTHFVPARAGSFTFPIVYQQGAWTVYEVR
jgi:hypothetical protein